MSFEYGSKESQIKNPFPFLGKLTIINGSLYLFLGIILFFVISAFSKAAISGQTSKLELFVYFAAGLWLALQGAYMLTQGLLMVNKFYVGRGMPADLAREVTKSKIDYANNQHSILFEAHQLEKTLLNRMNPSFLEPSGLLPRMLHTFNPRLLYLPLQIRSITQASFECAVYSCGILVLFILSLLSGVIGINNFTTTPLWKYIGWFYVLEILYVCYAKFPVRSYMTGSPLQKQSEKEMVFLIAYAILIPLIANFKSDVSDLSASPLPWLLGFPVLSIGSFVYIYFLSLKRIPENDPTTEVSEFREQWEESVNPQEIFRNVDMTLANYRYMEISNRRYRDWDTGLVSFDKGEYSGSMIQETQPIPIEEVNNSSLTSEYKKICAYAAHALIAIAGLMLFFIILITTPETGFQRFSSIVGILMFLYFGIILYKAAHSFFGEIRFKSHLIYFFADGTFNKSKLSTGMSVYDSMRSENELVRSSIRPWIVSAEIETTTFAVSGHYNLEQCRTILEMKKDDVWLSDIVMTLKSFLKNRQKLADTVSAGDLEATGRMAQINHAIRNGYTQPAEPNSQLEMKISEIMNDEVRKNYDGSDPQE